MTSLTTPLLEVMVSAIYSVLQEKCFPYINDCIRMHVGENQFHEISGIDKVVISPTKFSAFTIIVVDILCLKQMHYAIRTVFVWTDYPALCTCTLLLVMCIYLYFCTSQGSPKILCVIQ